MIKFIYICKKCNKHFPCRKEFTGYNGVYPPENLEFFKQCVSPFHRHDMKHDAEFVQVIP